MNFIDAFNAMSKSVNQTAVAHGFWEEDSAITNMPDNGIKIAMMHSELSEALEALRHRNPPDDKIPEFSGAEAELADAVIRIMDFARQKNLRLAEAIVAKNEYNKTRPYKHGKTC